MAIKVSAIVSTYNSERFLRGRLDDLLRQSLYAKGELEIIVVNAGSKQGEKYIARDYLGCITYIESLREPIYASWNRGIAIAKGEYITNANADDRYTGDFALEKTADVLDQQPYIGLVYTDAVVVDDKGQPSIKAPYFGKIEWPDFDAKLLLQGYYGGPNPMWRKAIHAQFGYFDDSFQLAGDYEFALRLAAGGVEFRHLHAAHTAFYDDGTNINNAQQAGMEARRALLRWRKHIR